MIDWTLLLQCLRIFAYVWLAVLSVFVIPAYRPRFHLAWRAIGLHFTAATLLVVLRLFNLDLLSLDYGDYVVTPTVLIVLVAVLLNLWQVSHAPDLRG